MSDHIPNYKPPRLQHGRTPYQNYLCRTVMHRPERSIFCGGGVNVTYNIKTPGFWSYVGMGIGQAFGSLFGGGFGGLFSGGFGGFGGCFGGGFPMMNFWNNPSLSWNNCNPFNWFKSKNSDGKGGADGKCEDPDLKKFNALDKEERELESKTTRTADEIENLKIRIEAAKKACDDNHKDENNDSYDNLLARIQKLKPTTTHEPAQVNLNNKPTEQADENPANTPTKQTVQTPVGDGRGAGTVEENSTPKAQAAPKAEVDLKNKDLSDIEVEEIKDINDASVAIAILKKAGRINDKDSSNKKVKFPRNYKELLLAQKSGLKIQFCKNNGLSGDRQCKTIEGTIVENITGEPASNTFTIKVKDVYGTYNLQLEYKQNNKGVVSLLSGSGAKVAYNNNGKTVTTELKNQRNNVTYNFDEKSDYATRNSSEAAMYSDNGKKKIQTK